MKKGLSLFFIHLFLLVGARPCFYCGVFRVTICRKQSADIVVKIIGLIADGRENYAEVWNDKDIPY